MASINSYKCPNCGANIPYDAKSGTLRCEHCGTEYDIDNLKAFNVEQENQSDVFKWNTDNIKSTEVKGKVTYVCPSCNGEVVGDENMSATTCPYCGSSIVINEKLSGVLEPNLIIPFKLSKDDAIKGYEKFISNKKLLPDDFKLKNIINKLNGVYVPYWLFDADATGHARFRCTRRRFYRTGDYEITETSHFLVIRDGSAGFVKVPVDASSKLDDALLDSLEPFDYSQAEDFKSAYLSNYLADKYDQDKDQTIAKANNRIKNTVSSLLTSTVIGYDSILPQSCYINVNNGNVAYALLPVYIFSTKYNGKIYQFAMNGQTGKFSGDLPMDKSKAIKKVLLTFVISFIAIYIIMMFIYGGF